MRRIRVQIPAALLIALGSVLTAVLPPAASANTRSQQHYAKGLIPFQAGQWESAYASFSNAAKADPDDAVARYYRGITGAHLGFVQESINDLELALQTRPDLHEAVLDLGVLYLEAGEYERAESWLKRAHDIPETRFRAALFLGVVNYRRGDDVAAQASLTEAAKDPRLRPVANYYEALSLLRQGKTAPAQSLMAKTELAMPGTPVAAAIKEFDGTAVRGVHPEDDDKPWSVYGAAGFAYDSNVKLAPDSRSIRNSRSQPGARDGGYRNRSDGRFQIALGGRYRVLDTSMFVGSVGYDLYQSTHFSNTEFDISSHRLRVDTSSRADRWYQFGLSGFYNYYARNYQSFFHEGTVVPWAAFYQGDVAATQVYYRFRARDYTRSPFERDGDPAGLVPGRVYVRVPRDAVNNAIGLRQLFLLGAVDRVLSVGYQWSDNDPLSKDGTDFAFQTHQFDIEIEAAVRDWFRTSLGYAVLIDDFEHPNSRNNFVHGRNDAEHQIVIHVERPLTQYLTAAVDYFGILNSSNLDPFEYDRNIVSAGVRMQF